MSRVPLVQPDGDDETLAPVFARFQGREPAALYRALANAPALLHAYSGLSAALRHEAATPRALRELAILRTAKLTGSRYEWVHHVPMAQVAGVDEAQIAALDDWRASGAFDARERAVLRCADELHECTLSDAAFAELSACFETAEVVELVLLLAFYQAVARLISGLGIEVEPGYARDI